MSRSTVSAEVQTSKVETDMSVAQLAFLCRMYYDLGFFINKNQSEMLRVAAGNFVTINASDISLKSLKAKYYNVDKSTKESVRKRVLAMLEYIDNFEK